MNHLIKHLGVQAETLVEALSYITNPIELLFSGILTCHHCVSLVAALVSQFDCVFVLTLCGLTLFFPLILLFYNVLEIL